MTLGQEVLVEDNDFVLWGFLFSAELNSILKLMLKLELKLPFLMHQTMVHSFVLQNLFGQRLGAAWKLLWVFLWVEEMDDLLMFGTTVRLGLLLLLSSP